MTIYPLLFIIFLCIMWTYSALQIGTERELNFIHYMVLSLITGVLLYLCGFFNAFHWPQITWICFNTIGCVMTLSKHGDYIESTMGTYLFALPMMLIIYIEGGAFQYLNH